MVAAEAELEHWTLKGAEEAPWVANSSCLEDLGVEAEVLSPREDPHECQQVV